MSNLSKKQKDFLKTIENKKYRKEQKIQFKLQNEFDGFMEQHPMNGVMYTIKQSNENSLTKEKLNELTNPEKTTNEIPKEFCVEITKENVACLTFIWGTFHKDTFGILKLGSFLHSNSLFTHCYQSNKQNDGLKKVKLVSTEEFLRYIGKEELIETPKRKFSDLPKVMVCDDILIFDREKYRRATLDEVVDKVVSLSLENIDALKVNEIEVVSPIVLSKNDYTNDVIEAIKLTYSKDEMIKAFYSARLCVNNLTIADSNPSKFKYPNIEDFLNSIK